MKFLHLFLAALLVLLTWQCSGGKDDSGTINIHTDPYKGFDVSDCGIDIDNLFNGGPNRDGIPAVINPVIMDLSNIRGSDFPIVEVDKVIILEINGETRAYPERLLWRHEIVNDVVGNVPVVVSYCPLTGSTVAFKRHADETFRVSGLLYETNLVMYDSTTLSLWPQMDFQCQCGPRRDEQLDVFSVKEMTWRYMTQLYPDTTVVVNSNRSSFDYLTYPYGTYDQLDNSSLLFSVSNLDRSFPIKSLTLMVFVEQEVKAYPHLVLVGNNRVINDQVGTTPIIVFNDQAGQFANAFIRVVDEQTLYFEAAEEGHGQPTSFALRDIESGSLWNLKGRAIEGPLAGRQLTQALNMNAMWFSFKVSFPSAAVFQP